MKRILSSLAAAVVVATTLSVPLNLGGASAAHAGVCAPLPGPWSASKFKILHRDKKNVSSIYSKYNSNRYESSDLNISVTTSRTDSSTVTYGANVKLSDVISEVDAHYDVAVTTAVTSGMQLGDDMSVMPRYYGRVRLQTIRTTYEKYRSRYTGPDCHLQTQVMWKARLITSAVHFAECQDKRNLCSPC